MRATQARFYAQRGAHPSARMHSLSTCWRTCAVLSKEKRIFLKCTQAKQQPVALPGPHVAECDPGGRNRGSVLEVPSSRASSPPTLRNGPVESIGLDRSQSPGKSGGCTVTRVTGHKALCPVTGVRSVNGLSHLTDNTLATFISGQQKQQRGTQMRLNPV